MYRGQKKCTEDKKKCTEDKKKKKKKRKKKKEKKKRCTENVRLSARFGGLENPADNRTRIGLEPFEMFKCSTGRAGFDYVGQGPSKWQP